MPTQVSHKVKPRDGETELWSCLWTNDRGYPCKTTLIAGDGYAALFTEVKRLDGDRKQVRFTTILPADVMDGVADAWLSARGKRQP